MSNQVKAFQVLFFGDFCQISGCHATHHEALSVDEVNALLQHAAVTPTKLKFTIENPYWDQLNHSLWLSFCRLLSTHTPNLVSLQFYTYYDDLSDDKMMAFIEQMPSTLRRLTLSYHKGHLPMTFRQLGMSLSGLETFIWYGYFFTTESVLGIETAKALGRSLLQLSNLKRVIVDLYDDSERMRETTKTALKPAQSHHTNQLSLV